MAGLRTGLLLPAAPRPEGPFVLPVWGGKGGIGKSNTAFELAYSLAQIGPTLLVNADKRQTDGGVTDLANNLAGKRGGCPFELMETDERAELAQLRRLKQFRYVVTDNAPHRDEAKLRAAAKGDLVIVPMPPRYSDIKAVMSSIRDHLKPIGASYRVLLTMVEYGRRNRAMSLQETMKGVGMPCYGTYIRKYDAHETAGSSGVPVIDGGGGNNCDKAGEDVYNFVDETLAAIGESFRVARQTIEAAAS